MSKLSPFPSDAGLRKPVCVFCGSSPGNDKSYIRAAESLGRGLAREKIPVVYGGGRRGIMGVVSKSTLQAGGYVHGIIPKALVSSSNDDEDPGESSKQSGEILRSSEGVGKELLDDDVDGRLTLQIVRSMHERKLKMAQVSTGGFIVLPGGYGTFEEMMEMITWNQLGIHRLPVLVLNIGNFFSPLRALLENAVEAGFIAEKNLSLVQFVDLPSTSTGGSDDWGRAAVQTLKDWSFAAGAGLSLDWGDIGEVEKEGKSDPPHAKTRPALFTTLRYTSPNVKSPTSPVEKSQIPLLDRHIHRLQEAHRHFRERDGAEIWGDWVGHEELWRTLKARLEEVERQQPGDWRVRVLIHSGGEVEVQVVPAPAGAGPFQFLASVTPTPSAGRRPLVLDSKVSHIDSESQVEKDSRLYKTTERGIYDAASNRGAEFLGSSAAPEVLLHTETHILETSTSNIAILFPSSGTEELEWMTPKLDRKRWPFLDGVMRRHLLEKVVIKEAELTVSDWDRAKREGSRVIGFNGLRGVWEAEPLCFA